MAVKKITASQWVQLVQAIAQLTSGQITLPEFIAMAASIFTVPVPSVNVTHAMAFASIMASAAIPANLQADLQAVVDAATAVNADQASLKTAQANVVGIQGSLTNDQATLATAQTTFNTDLAAFLATP